MKKITFVFLAFLIFYCCKNNSNIQEINKNNRDDKPLIDSLQGEKLLMDKGFISSINNTCGDNSDSCVVRKKITKSYYEQFKYLNIKEISLLKNNNIEIKLYKEDKEQDFLLQVMLVTFIDNKKTDSIVCYEFNDNPDNFVVCQRLYYINNQYQLWTLDLTYDETIVTMDEWERYKIDSITGKIKLIERLRNKYIIFDDDSLKVK